MAKDQSQYRDVTTLAIEATDLRFVSTKKGAVDKWGSVPLPQGLISQGFITNAPEMGKVIDELFTAQNLSRKRVISSMTGLRSIPRLLNLPKLQASMMEETIAREAKKEMPLSLENLYLSWESIPGTGDQQRIYLLGVPRELVDAQVHALQGAGIALYAIDLKPLALIRAVGRSEAILANLEQNTLDVVVVVDYLPAIMRTFSLENENMDDLARLDRLANELNQTVRFYNDSHQNEPIDPTTPLFLSGKALSSRSAAEYIRNVVDRPVERPSSPLPCPGDLPVVEYVTNLGLALKQAI
ncbi:MAG: type IV pilus biogenesis protein PilM [Anaerolineae bacterium]